MPTGRLSRTYANSRQLRASIGARSAAGSRCRRSPPGSYPCAYPYPCPYSVAIGVVPFSSFGGDPFSGGGGGLGDFLGGGGFGTTTSSPGGNIAETANVQGDPTGALQAQQSIQAGAPTPGTPGGGIGGAQSNAGTPSGPAQLAQQSQPATFSQRFQGLPPTGTEMPSSFDPSQTSSVPKTTGPGSGTPQQFGPEQPPASFGQRFGDPQAASFDQRFGTSNMAQPGPQAAQVAQAGINFPESGMAPTGTPSVDQAAAAPPTTDATQQAGPAAPPADTGAPPTAPSGAGRTPDTTGITHFGA